MLDILLASLIKTLRFLFAISKTAVVLLGHVPAPFVAQ
jgi:hypothetical protein